MRKFLVFPDSTCAELSPFTYEEFVKLDRWSGLSDTAFSRWMRHNGFHEMDQFNEEIVKAARIELVAGEPTFEWFPAEHEGHDSSACGKCDGYSVYRAWPLSG